VALSHLSILTLARLSRTYEWAMLAAYGLVLGVAFLLTGMIWGELDSAFYFRTLGVLAILDGAVTILIPIFHRLSKADLGPKVRFSLAEIDREIAQLEDRLRELKAKRQAAETMLDVR
jgi:hypothetical protein